MIKTAYSAVIAAALAATSMHTMAQPTDATAQPQTPTQAPALTQDAAPPVDEKKVKKFVAAYTDVQEVRQDYSEKLQNVQDPEKAKNLQEKAHAKMDNAVEDNGLSVDEYRELAQQINENPALLTMVQEELMKAAQ